MPSKKPTKKPGKAIPGKAGQKAAAPKRAARPLLKHTPIATSKVPVKPNKPIPRPAAVKAAGAGPTPVKPAAVQPAAINPASIAPEAKSHDADINDNNAPIK